ncbi:hypothetical protein ARMGADRAFT_1083218 [Armillaria gallica]|uniref:Integral membrane protein n=1 Tax=Armillaria gallica TaxID=47427 RepID=A0A2H3D3B4_ARMGA|nr:hypothetical protein ARMGADRAFT_1083218 [Armillaria gallica]
MAIQTDIPLDVTDDYKAIVFRYLDAQLNSGILYALLYGIYTGILAVTLWNIFINKCWPIRRAMVIVIILIHTLITINFASYWSLMCLAFIKNGQSFWSVFLELNDATKAAQWEMGITASISTILADLYMIWFCWMVWGRRWLVVLLPIFSLVSAIVSRIIMVYYDYVHAPVDTYAIIKLYISFNLATTLSCTLLIIYRIVTTVGAGRRAEGRLKVYHRFIEVLVESSALYSVSLILDLAFTISIDSGSYYADTIASIMKGIAPTLLVGRITVGRRARPDDSWQGSVVASASIRSQEQEYSRTSSQEDRPTSLVLDGDLEAQRENSEPSSTSLPRPSAQSQGVMTLPKFENFPLYHLGDTEGSNRVSVETLKLGP